MSQLVVFFGITVHFWQQSFYLTKIHCIRATHHHTSHSFPPTTHYSPLVFDWFSLQSRSFAGSIQRLFDHSLHLTYLDRILCHGVNLLLGHFGRARNPDLKTRSFRRVSHGHRLISSNTISSKSFPASHHAPRIRHRHHGWHVVTMSVVTISHRLINWPELGHNLVTHQLKNIN